MSTSDQDDCALSQGGCSDGCIQGPFGAQCTCPVGYQLLNDSKTCADVDECLTPGFCSQQCFNERGTFRCSCSEGYQLEPNGRTCKATGEMKILAAVMGCVLTTNYYQQITLSPITGHSSGLFRLYHFAFINNVIHLNIALTLSIK